MGDASFHLPISTSSSTGTEHVYRGSLLRAWSSAVSLDSLADDSQSLCPVCLGGYRDGHLVTALPCRHAYHRDCIYPWLLQQGRAATCPMCKANVFE